MLGYDAFKIHLAHALKQGHAMSFYVIRVEHSDAEAFGNYRKDRNEIFLECINMVLDIWKGEAPYRLSGKYFSVTTEKTMIREIGQGSIIRPFQKPHPPIVVTAVAPHSNGVTEAAKRG